MRSAWRWGGGCHGDGGALMILVWIIVIPNCRRLPAWMLGRDIRDRPLDSAVVLVNRLGCRSFQQSATLVGDSPHPGPWLVSFDLPWIPALGIHFLLAVDGLSLILLLMTDFRGHHGGGIGSGPRFRTASGSSTSICCGFWPASRRISGAGPLSLLFLLGNDAGAHVLYHCHLGARKTGVCGDQVFSVHPDQRPVHAHGHLGPLLHSRPHHRPVHVQLPAPSGHFPLRRQPHDG